MFPFSPCTYPTEHPKPVLLGVERHKRRWYALLQIGRHLIARSLPGRYPNDAKAWIAACRLFDKE